MTEPDPLTWCGVPYSQTGQWVDPENGEKEISDACIFGIPYEAGASASAGQAEAPFAIRHLETFDSWRTHTVGDLSTLKVVDAGDADIDRRYPQVGLAKTQNWIKTISESTRVMIGLGGDHSITAAVLKYVVAGSKPLDVIHLDAHSDTWPEESTLAVPPFFPTHAGWVPWVIENKLVGNVFQFGIRAMGPDHDADQRVPNITRSTGMLSNQDFKTFIAFAKRLPVVRPIYLTIDMDVVEPSMCPGVAYPEPGGWMPFTLLDVIEKLVASLPIVAVDIVEITPALDRDNLSVRLAHRSVLAVLKGIKRRKDSVKG